MGNNGASVGSVEYQINEDDARFTIVIAKVAFVPRPCVSEFSQLVSDRGGENRASRGWLTWQ